MIHVRKIESSTASSGGEYRPMGYYKNNGYDVDMIEKNCKLKKFDEVVGWVYKVYVDGDREDTTDERVREKEYGGNAIEKGKCGKKGKESVAVKGAKRESVAVKKAKAADATKRQAQREASKQAGNNKKMASRTVTKVAAVSMECQEISKDKFLKDLPEFSIDAFNVTKDAIFNMEKQAKSVMRTGAAYDVQVAVVDEAVAEAKSTIMFMRNLLETSKAMRGMQVVKGEPID